MPVTPFSWTHDWPSVLVARMIRCRLLPGSVAITFVVFARPTLARTVTRAEAPAAASDLSRLASAPPTKSAGTL